MLLRFRAPHAAHVPHLQTQAILSRPRRSEGNIRDRAQCSRAGEISQTHRQTVKACRYPLIERHHTVTSTPVYTLLPGRWNHISQAHHTMLVLHDRPHIRLSSPDILPRPPPKLLPVTSTPLPSDLLFFIANHRLPSSKVTFLTVTISFTRRIWPAAVGEKGWSTD